ncbi:MAG: hypothetical protein AB8B91_02645 [Rubripirellula sp.]
MRILISNLNVIRATRLAGFLRNRFERISTILVEESVSRVHSVDTGCVEPVYVKARVTATYPGMPEVDDQPCRSDLSSSKSMTWRASLGKHLLLLGQAGASHAGLQRAETRS